MAEQGPFPRLGVGVALMRAGKILLLKRRHAPEAGCWSFPGGRLEWLEPVEDAARREVCEETGMRVGALTLLCMTEWIAPEATDRQAEHWAAPVYLCTDFSGEPVRVEPESHAAMDWFAPDALPNPLTNAVRKAAALLSGK